MKPENTSDLCPLCHTDAVHRQYTKAKLPIQHCRNCDVEFLSPQTSDTELTRIYSEHYFIGSDDDASQQRSSQLKLRTAKIYLDHLQRKKPHGGHLLEIGCGQGDFLLQARTAGFTVQGLDFSPHAVAVANAKLADSAAQAGDLVTAGYPDNHFDVVVMFDLIEHTRSPALLLQHAQRILKPGGTLMLVTPAHDSLSARLLRSHWMEYKAEHLFYFSRQSLLALLKQTGYGSIQFRRNIKYLSLDYLAGHFDKFPVPVLTPVFGIIRKLLPSAVTNLPLQLSASGWMVLADKSTPQANGSKLNY